MESFFDGNCDLRQLFWVWTYDLILAINLRGFLDET